MHWFFGNLGEPLTSQGTLLTPEDLIEDFQAIPGAQKGVDPFEDHLQSPRRDTGAWTPKPTPESLHPDSGPRPQPQPLCLTLPLASTQSPTSYPRGISCWGADPPLCRQLWSGAVLASRWPSWRWRTKQGGCGGQKGSGEGEGGTAVGPGDSYRYVRCLSSSSFSRCFWKTSKALFTGRRAGEA